MAREPEIEHALIEAIDDHLADTTYGEQEASIFVHADDCTCAESVGGEESCAGIEVIVPPARVADIWWWERHLTALTRRPTPA